MYTSIFASFLCAFIPISQAFNATRLIHQFPKGTWIGNLAVLSSGSLLLTIASPDLDLLNPLVPNPQPQLIHRFSSNTWLTGIIETKPDTYYLIGANATY